MDGSRVQCKFYKVHGSPSGDLLCSAAEVGLCLCRSVQQSDGCRQVAVSEPDGVGPSASVETLACLVHNYFYLLGPG